MKVPLERGDVVVCYSDGIIESERKCGELFGFDRVAWIIADSGL